MQHAGGSAHMADNVIITEKQATAPEHICDDSAVRLQLRLQLLQQTHHALW